MRITSRQLLGLPVYTQSDYFLGHVIGFELDTDHHVILRYLVAKNKVVSDLLKSVVGSDPLTIAATQVVAILEDKMVVYDAAVADEDSLLTEQLSIKQVS